MLLTENNIDPIHISTKVNHVGFAIVPQMLTPNEIRVITDVIDACESSRDTFRRSVDLFAIRQFLKEVPDIVPLIFNQKLKDFINKLIGREYFIVKSIYFDKPETSNWYVAYHQDLTISVTEK